MIFWRRKYSFVLPRDQARSTNRGSDHYSTGLLSARTMGILRQNPVFRDFLDAVAPPGIAEITSLWLTWCSDALSEENPDGGYHDIHGDGRDTGLLIFDLP